MERKEDDKLPPSDDSENPDLMKSTLIALGWEESDEANDSGGPETVDEKLQAMGKKIDVLLKEIE
ncbi:MAG: hypothetical protein ACTSRA_15930, partial [Promethearchaeota archaeon]